MRFDLLRWFLIPAIALHNLEEWLTVGAYGTLDGGLFDGVREPGPPPSVAQLDAALLLATILPSALVAICSMGNRLAIKDWLVCLVACVFMANALLPHIPASILAGGYSPGVISAVLINIPLAAALLHSAAVERGMGRVPSIAAIAGGFVALPLSVATIWPIAKALA